MTKVFESQENSFLLLCIGAFIPLVITQSLNDGVVTGQYYTYVPLANNYVFVYVAPSLSSINYLYYCSVYDINRIVGSKYHYVCMEQKPCPVCNPGYFMFMCGYDSGLFSGICTACPACPSGYYNNGCNYNGSSAGTCTACKTDCPSGQYRKGCSAVSEGYCTDCSNNF